MIKHTNPRILASVKLMQKHGNTKNLRIIELGCNEGSVLAGIAVKLDGPELYGVDIDPALLQLATSKGIRTHVVDLNRESISYPDAFFDVVLMEEVIEHLVNPDNAIQEAFRILKPHGLFLVTTPNLGWWLNRLTLLLGYQPYWTECSVKYNVGKYRRSLSESQSGHLRVFTWRALKNLLELNGFSIIATEGITYNSLPSILKTFDKLFSKRISQAEILVALAQKEKKPK